MAVDPVCNMEVDEKQSEHKSEHMGRILYFCCEECKREFDRDPSQYPSAAA